MSRLVMGILLLTVALAEAAPHPDLSIPAQAILQLTPAPGPTVEAAPMPIQVWPPGVEASTGVMDPRGGCATTKNTQVGGLVFCCPSAIQNPIDLLQPTDRTDVTTCPFRVHDETFHFGNAQLAVHPETARELVFISLHSDPARDGPTPRSRSPGGTHTAFTTVNQGVNWQDEPIPCGAGGGEPGRGIYGEAGSVVMDPKGNMAIAYLWNTDGTNTSYGSSIGLYKAGIPEDFESTVCQAYGDPFLVESRTVTNPIARVYMTYVAPYTPPSNTTNSTAGNNTGPSRPEEIGQKAVETGPEDDGRIVAAWFERATVEPWGPNGYPGWIDARITHTGSDNFWEGLDHHQVIGPCMEGSNPVAWRGAVYVACVVEKGYTHRSGARIGDVDLWTIDPMTGNTSLVASTPLAGGRPLLAVTPDGYFALATTSYESDELPARVNVAFGWYGVSWQPIGDVGRVLHALAGARPTFDAGLTALALSPETKMAALVYMEWQQPADPSADPPSLPDPSDPAAVRQRLTDYRRIVAIADECGAFPLAAAELQLGTGYDAYNHEAYVERPSVFDDFQDGLVPFVDSGGQELWYFAVNDYGAMQYGAILATAVPSSCAVIPPPLPIPAAAVPQALSFTTGANILVGSTVGVAATAMVVYLLTVKRRAASSVAAEDK